MKKKKMLMALGLSAALIAPGLTVSAAENNAEGGEVDLDVAKDSILPAKVEYVGGGTWNHWITLDQVGSEYYHGSKTHKASVKNSRATVSSGWVAKGKWAIAKAKASVSGNKAYWDTK